MKNRLAVDIPIKIQTKRGRNQRDGHKAANIGIIRQKEAIGKLTKGIGKEERRPH